MGDARYSSITGVWYDDTIEIPAIVKEAWKNEDEAPGTSSKNINRKRKRSGSPSNNTNKRTKYAHGAEFQTQRITPRRQRTPKIKSVVIKPKPPTELADIKAQDTEKPSLKKAAEEDLPQSHCVNSMDEFLLDFSYMDTLTDINFL